jgi:hypothetical protein
LRAEVASLTLELEKSRQESKEKIEAKAVKEHEHDAELEQLELKYLGRRINFDKLQDSFRANEEQWKEEKRTLSQRIVELEAHIQSKSSEKLPVAPQAPTKELSPFR